MDTLTGLGNVGILRTLRSVGFMQNIGQRPTQNQPQGLPRWLLRALDRKPIAPHVLVRKPLQAILWTLRRHRIRAPEGRSKGLVLRMTWESWKQSKAVRRPLRSSDEKVKQGKLGKTRESWQAGQGESI